MERPESPFRRLADQTSDAIDKAVKKMSVPGGDVDLAQALLAIGSAVGALCGAMAALQEQFTPTITVPPNAS